MTSSPFAFDEAQQEQQHNRSHKGAHKFSDFSRGTQTQQAKEETAQQRADDTNDEVAKEAEAVTFDDHSRQKPGG
jgi:hypothetical protein